MGMRQFNINNQIYDNIGSISISGHNYIIIRHENDIKMIEMIIVDNKPTYLFPSIDFNNPSSLKGILFCNELITDIKNNMEQDINLKISNINKALEQDNDFNNMILTSDINSFRSTLANIYQYAINYQEPTKELQNIDLTVDELQRLLSTKKEELTEEQIIMFENMLEERQKEEISTGNTASKRLAKNIYGNKTIDEEIIDTKENKAAYVSLISLCLFVQVFLLLGILALVYFMK